MENLIDALNDDAARYFEKRVSRFAPYRVKAMDLSHTAIADYDETTEDCMNDVIHELLIEELNRNYVG